MSALSVRSLPTEGLFDCDNLEISVGYASLESLLEILLAELEEEIDEFMELLKDEHELFLSYPNFIDVP